MSDWLQIQRNAGSEVFCSLNKIEAWVTRADDISQIGHSPAHSDAALDRLANIGRCSALGYFAGRGKLNALTLSNR